MPIRQRYVSKSSVTIPQVYDRDATFSEDKVYRYTLWRRWAAGPLLVFIMLNPSTADAFKNDPTVARCEKRARAMGFGGFMVLNLFAFRATRPEELKKTMDPIGPRNDNVIKAILIRCRVDGNTVVAAWGSHGRYLNRAREVSAMAKEFGVQLYCLAETQSYEPRHPLYLEDKAELKPWPKILRLPCPA